MSEKAYKIFVGDARPADAQLGYLEMNTGNTIIKGTAKPAQPIGGFAVFANRSISWGRRLVKGKPAEDDRRVQPTDKDYTGQIEWMEHGAEGGYPITVRYKQACSTLDYDYQITQLNMLKFQEDIEDNYLQMPFGENNIFYDSEAVKAEFFKIHHENDDSVSKNPNAVGGMWHEIKLFDTTKQEVKKIDTWFESASLIKSCETHEKLNVLKGILGKKVQIKEDADDQNSLYENLQLYAKEKPDDFMGSINTYKRKVSDLISRCQSYNAFDLTKNGVIRVGQTKMEDLLTEVPEKGEAMLDWMFQNCLQPVVFAAIDKLIHISQKFK